MTATHVWLAALAALLLACAEGDAIDDPVQDERAGRARALLVPDDVFEADPGPGAPTACELAQLTYDEAVAAQSCASADAIDCLEPTSYIATRGDGRRVRVSGVYRIRASDIAWANHGDSEIKEHPLPHLIGGKYLRALRNLYASCPGAVNQVYNQVDYLVSDGLLRNGALVWENRDGYAHGMEQSTTAYWLAQLASLHHQHGRDDLARATVRYALQATRAFFLPVGPATGGVRSVDTSWCAVKTARKRPCFWFHSRGRRFFHSSDDPRWFHTVLNQHLHVVRDSLDLSVSLRAAAAAGYLPTDVPVPSGEGYRTFTDWSDALEDRAIGGLYVLAFGAGNTAAAPARPPNLAQFMERRADLDPTLFIAAYEYDLGQGRAFISKRATCGYQSHSVNLLGGLKASIRQYLGDPANGVPSRLTEGYGWRLDEAMTRLLQHPADEPVGAAGSTSALYQFYWTQWPGYFLNVWGCPEDAEQMSRRVCEELAPSFGMPIGWCGLFPG